MSSLEKNLYKRVRIPAAPQQRNPSRTYRGFSTVSTNEGYQLYDFDLIKQDIINHFHIRQGEKLSDPTFGSVIWDLLFEPFTDRVKEIIVDNVTEIVNYDPRVSVESILVDTYEQGIQVECVITFLPYGISEELRFRFDQQAGLLN
jgi:phage baseplate assembly protein W